MISIIVPVYNSEKYIDRCLDSILNQTYKDLEIVLVNDGSNDQSLKILENYALRDTRIKVVKNKVAPPFKEAEFDIMFGQGISREGDLIDLAVKVDAVQKSGAWYAYKGEKIGQGRENAKTFLREHPEIMAEVEVQVREYYNLPTDTVVESASQEEGQPKAGDNQNGQFDSITTEE